MTRSNDDSTMEGDEIMTEKKPSIYDLLETLAIGEQLTTVSAGTTFLFNPIWAGFYEGNAKFLEAGVLVYIPIAKIQYIHR